MAVGLQRFEIILDNPTNIFFPGDTVGGRVIVELGKTKSIRGFKIRFKGTAEVSWSETTGTGKDETTDWYRNCEEYFRMEYYLLGGVGDERVEIESGCHLFPFTFTLPHDIPNSFESFYGNVRYTIKATMDRPWKFDHNTDISLAIQSPYDLSHLPAAQLPIQAEEDKTFGCFPFDMGSLTVMINLPTSGFVVGEAIEATLTINNHSKSVHVTKIKLKLQQKIKLHAFSRTKSDVRIVQTAERLGPFNNKDIITLGMQVSDTPPSGFPHCSIIDIKYRLIVQVCVSGCHRKMERDYPIFIGRRSAAPSAPFLENDNSTGEKPPPTYDVCMNIK